MKKSLFLFLPVVLLAAITIYSCTKNEDVQISLSDQQKFDAIKTAFLKNKGSLAALQEHNTAQARFNAYLKEQATVMQKTAKGQLSAVQLQEALMKEYREKGQNQWAQLSGYASFKAERQHIHTFTKEVLLFTDSLYKAYGLNSKDEQLGAYALYSELVPTNTGAMHTAGSYSECQQYCWSQRSSWINAALNQIRIRDAICYTYYYQICPYDDGIDPACYYAHEDYISCILQNQVEFYLAEEAANRECTQCTDWCLYQ